MKRKILLIKPVNNSVLTKLKFLKVPCFSLLALKSVTPKKYEVEITEMSKDSKIVRVPDLVGITVMTNLAYDSYKIADKFRKLGSKVILGGIHVSLLPDEASHHADSVVIGEAEIVWPKVLSDYERGSLKEKYIAEQYLDLTKLPLIKNEGFLFFNYIQTSRGCPFNCDFCSVTKFNGTKLRHKKIQDVVTEIKSFKSWFRKHVIFVDDNIVGDKKYAKELFEALIPLNIRWFAQSSIDIAEDDELVDLAYRSGCRCLFIGLESINKSSLEGNVKGKYISSYEPLLGKLKEKGILIYGAFVFGFDNDNKHTFKETLDFCLRNKIDFMGINTLTPLPGTTLFDRLDKEDRILTKDWSFYDYERVVFKPVEMNADELYEGIHNIHSSFYSYQTIFHRVFSIKNKIKYKLCLLLANIFLRSLNRI